MFHGKCAFCESKIDHISYGDIEHFRPKSTFPEYTFMWSNLLLACEVCNRTCKKTQFPLENNKAVLLNPSLDEDFDSHLKFEFDTELGQALVLGTTVRGQTSEKILGLNRKNLLNTRTTYLKNAIFVALYAKEHPEDKEAIALLGALSGKSGQYLAFVRKYVSMPGDKGES